MARILIIDDSVSAIEKATRVLVQAGYTVESLELLTHLAEKVRTDPPDLILLDLSMPALSGINVAKLIQRFQTRPVPIVLYSSRPSDEQARVVRELGAVGYIQKGEPATRLIAVVEMALNIQARQSQAQ